MKKKWKILLWIFGVVFFILVFLYFYGIYGDRINAYLNGVYERKVERAYEEGQKKFEEILRNDKTGGKTPEETMEMFILALKENNPQKASAFYEYEVREKALAGLNKELKEKGNLNQSLEYFSRVFEKGEKGCASDIMCGFEYVYITTEDKYVSLEGMNTKIFVPKGSQERMITDLILNDLSGVWKISQPY